MPDPQNYANHPLLSRFWKREGVQHEENDSMTLSDTAYTIRLDEEPRLIKLIETEVCCYTSASTIKRTFNGSWESLCLRDDKVVLLLQGTDENGKAIEASLYVTAKDIGFTTVEYGRKFAAK